MNNQWKKLAAAFGAAAITVCQSGTLQVNAEEIKTQEATVDEVNVKETDAQEASVGETNPGGANTQEADVGETNTENDAQAANVEESNTEADAQAANVGESNTKADAQEASVKEANTEEANTEEANTQETQLDAVMVVENQADEVSVEPPQWSYAFGYATFKIPYEKGTATYKFSLYKNGEFYSALDLWHSFDNLEKGTMAQINDPVRVINTSGTYEIKAEIFNIAGEQIGSVTSSSLDYKAPDESIPIPSNIVWNEDGTFSCDLDIDNRYIDSYNFEIYDQTGEYVCGCGIALFAVDSLIERGFTITNTQKGIALNLNEFITYYGFDAPSIGYSVKINVWSNDKTVYQNSAMSDPVYLGGIRPQPPVTDNETDKNDQPIVSGNQVADGQVEGNQPTDNQTTNSQTMNTASQSNPTTNPSEEPALVKVKDWQPVTPDEKKRYAAYGKETISFTVDTKGAYDVKIQNAMQGPLCFDSFESVLGDYTIGRTYNIFPSGNRVYKMDQKARISLSIPKALQSVNRTFQMICVTENGVPVILEDLNPDPGMITFETDTYYAFALVYKDITE